MSIELLDDAVSSASFDTQVCVEKMNKAQLRRSSSETVRDDESDFMPPSPGSQRWASESETCFDNSPTPPPISRLQRSGSEDHWNHIMDKQRTLLVSRPGPLLDNENYLSPPPPFLLQRWASESEEQEQNIDESPASSSASSSSLGRWASDPCGAAYRCAPLLPARRPRIRVGVL